MKNTRRLTVLAALSVALVSAQGPRPGHRGPGDGGTPPTTEEMVQMRVNALTRRLGLTEAQQAQAKTIFTQAATASEAPRASMKTTMDAIHAAVKTNDVGTINSQAVTYGTLAGQLMSVEQKANAAFYAILTAEQKTKFDARPMGGPGMMGGFGEGGRRPMRGPRAPEE